MNSDFHIEYQATLDFMGLPIFTLSSQHDVHVRAAKDSDKSPRSHTYVASRRQ